MRWSTLAVKVGIHDMNDKAYKYEQLLIQKEHHQDAQSTTTYIFLPLSNFLIFTSSHINILLNLTPRLISDFNYYPEIYPNPLLHPPTMSNSTSTSTDSDSLYKYSPSLPAALSFAILFLITTLLHTYQLLRTRVWYFIPLFLGGLFEILGFIGRIIGARETYPNYILGPYIIQTLFLLIAPVFFSASVYMELGHIIRLTGQLDLSPIKLKFLTVIFVLGDFFAFMVQSTGGSVLAKGEADSATTGKWIIIGGLAIQLISFGFFMVVAALFHSRCNQNPTKRSESKKVPWRKHMWALYLASALIVVRSLFRLVEYVMCRTWS